MKSRGIAKVTAEVDEVNGGCAQDGERLSVSGEVALRPRPCLSIALARDVIF